MILNNCTTCGMIPTMKTTRILRGEITNFFWCRCGKCVYSDSAIWPKETAADMWNRANPVEEETMHDNQVNRIADELAICGIKADVSTGKLILSPSNNGFSVKLVMSRIRKARMHETELTEFYLRRLEAETTT